LDDPLCPMIASFLCFLGLVVVARAGIPFAAEGVWVGTVSYTSFTALEQCCLHNYTPGPLDGIGTIQGGTGNPVYVNDVNLTVTTTSLVFSSLVGGARNPDIANCGAGINGVVSIAGISDRTDGEPTRSNGCHNGYISLSGFGPQIDPNFQNVPASFGFIFNGTTGAFVQVNLLSNLAYALGSGGGFSPCPGNDTMNAPYLVNQCYQIKNMAGNYMAFTQWVTGPFYKVGPLPPSSSSAKFSSSKAPASSSSSGTGGGGGGGTNAAESLQTSFAVFVSSAVSLLLAKLL